MTTIAILDEKSQLVGLRLLDVVFVDEEDDEDVWEEEVIPEGAVVVVDECNIPVDGTYEWMPRDKCFHLITTIAVLDEKFRLIELRQLDPRRINPEGEVISVGEAVPENAVVVVDECDLPTDGTYKWMSEDRCFMPIGHGLGKPGSAPISTETVVLLLASNMDNPPQEVLDWIKWYRELSET